MSTERQQDAGMDRLIRAALDQETPPAGDACPDADTVAAYADGALTARERTDLEPHLASCVRCQAVLAVMARASAAEAVDTRSTAVSAWRAWFSVPRLRWLVPAGAAALAVVLYVALKPGPTVPGLQETAAPATVPAAAAEFTMAGRLEKGERPGDLRTPQPDRPASIQPKAVAGSAPAPAEEKRTAPDAAPQIAGTALQVAQPTATAANASARPAQTAEAQAASLAMAASPVSERQAVAAPAASDDLAARAGAKAKDKRGGGLDSSWAEADVVVLARVVASRSAFPDKERIGQDRGSAIPGLSADVAVLEVFKRPDGMSSAARLAVLQTAGEARDEPAASRADSSHVALQPGEEYVLFLNRDPAAAAHGYRVSSGVSVYRLQGEVVTVGSRSTPDPDLTRAGLLAALRERAAAKR